MLGLLFLSTLLLGLLFLSTLLLDPLFLSTLLLDPLFLDPLFLSTLLLDLLFLDPLFLSTLLLDLLLLDPLFLIDAAGLAVAEPAVGAAGLAVAAAGLAVAACSCPVACSYPAFASFLDLFCLSFAVFGFAVVPARWFVCSSPPTTTVTIATTNTSRFKIVAFIVPLLNNPFAPLNAAHPKCRVDEEHKRQYGEHSAFPFLPRAS